MSLEETIRTFLGDLSRSKTSDPDIPFTEENGVTGIVSMGYIYSMPLRENPEKKQLIIKRIEVFGGKGIVTATLQKILRETELTEIKIETIQNKEWIPNLQRKGWTIEEDHGGLTHAIMKKGGKRTRRTNHKRRKSRKFIR
jgi:predicted RNA binding protein YcfA (HicA-like mRNA interferase family)